MAESSKQTPPIVQIVPSDPAWPQRYQDERALIVQAVTPFVAIEHIGSTAVPGLAAKPYIDIMAAVAQLSDGVAASTALAGLGYELRETGMPGRLFLRKHDRAQGLVFHLHIVEYASWPERNERLLRDYLLAHPEAAQAYGALKQELALAHPDDGLAYTKAKTGFIQSIVDAARDERGLARVDVWEE
ncbi:MAG TPA: GrpB family protein [Roseiflexaceae bacterium]|nr:GrpB family protein [Roseiflexaceae bacterium]